MSPLRLLVLVLLTVLLAGPAALAAGAAPRPDGRLLGLTGSGEALLGAGGGDVALAPDGSRRAVTTLPRHGAKLGELFAADDQVVAGASFVDDGGGDEETASGTESILAAPAGSPQAPVALSRCGIDLEADEPLPVPLVALAGARLAVAQPCSPEDRDVPEGGVSVVDVSAATPTPVLLATDPADGMAGGVALNATQVAVRTPAEVEVADSATGAVQRTVPTGVTGELGPTTPVALAEDGTIFTASPAAIPDEGADPPWGELCDSAGPLVRLDPAGGAPVPLADGVCAAPLTMTPSGLLFVQRGAPGIGRLMLLGTGGGPATVLRSFRDTEAGTPPASNPLGDSYVFSNSSGTHFFSTPVSVPFAYVAQGSTLAVRSPGCAAPASVTVGPLAPAPAGSLAPCSLTLSAPRLHAGRVSVRARCAAGCDGAWNVGTGEPSSLGARPLVSAPGRSVTLSAPSCSKRGGHNRRLRFTASTTNAGAPVVRALRVRC